jgi:5'-methylthioadenosine phosphorylase
MALSAPRQESDQTTMSEAVLGIIGGSGIYDLPGLTDIREERIESPWGEPSDALRIGRIGRTKIVFLPRHGRGHVLSPSDINYRANIDVLKRAGVTDLVSLSACGSYKAELYPGMFVLVDQFVDRTVRRESSFFGKGCVAHVSLAQPVGPALQTCIAEAAQAESVPYVRGGTLVTMEGPQFSTYAESMSYRGLGFDLIGMTAMPEAKLAREAEITYATVAMVTDYDCWHELHGAVDVASVVQIMHDNADKARRLALRARQRDHHRARLPRPRAARKARRGRRESAAAGLKAGALDGAPASSDQGA